MLRLTALLVLCCAPGLAWADVAPCRNGDFALQSQGFGLANVVGGPRVYLRSDNAPCPNDTADCRNRIFVIPGDTVLTGATQAGFICAFFPGKGGGSAGYVRPDEIAMQPSPTPPLSAWAGKWMEGDNYITLRVRGGQLLASGMAYWPSAHPSLKDRPGGANLGPMSGKATPQGNRLVFPPEDENDCRIAATLVPPYLIVADSADCGGMNVTFTGVYRKT